MIGDEATILIPLYSVILLLSVTGNCAVIVTLVKNKLMRVPTNIMLMNLAVADLLLGVICMPFTLIGSLLRNFIFGYSACKIIPYLQAVTVAASSWTLLTISAERYMGICYPLRSRGWWTNGRARLFMFLVWFLALLLLAPICYTSSLQPIGNTGRFKCREEWPSVVIEQLYYLLLLVLMLIIPLVVMVTSYVCILRVLRRSIKEESSGTEERLYEGSNCNINKEDQSRTSLSHNLKKMKTSEDKKNYLDAPGSNSVSCNITHINSSRSKFSSLMSLKYKSGFKNEQFENCQVKNDMSSNKTLMKQDVSQNKTINQTVIRKSNTKKSLQNKRRIIVMLTVVVFEFFVCWTPLSVLNTIALFNAPAVYRFLGMSGVSFIQLLAYCSICCNPITYCFMNASFRKALRQTLGCSKPTKDNSTRFQSVLRTCTTNNVSQQPQDSGFEKEESIPFRRRKNEFVQTNNRDVDLTAEIEFNSETEPDLETTNV